MRGALLLLGLIGVGALGKEVPAIIAHRGNPAQFPENTLPGFESGSRIADGVKIDAQETKDGELVVMHDETVDRTTDGLGKVSELTLDQVRKLDAGGKSGDGFKGLQVPTVAEVIQRIPSGKGITIERKAGSPASYVEFFRRQKLVGKACLASTDWEFLREVKHLEPKMIMAVSMAGATWSPDIFERLRKLGAGTVLWYKAFAPPRSCAAAHRRGIKVFVYTINDLAEARAAALGGADGILTDNPELLVRAKEYLIAR